MWAMRAHAFELSMDFSQSLANLLQRFSHAKVELCPKVGDGLKRAAYHGGVESAVDSQREKDMPPWLNLQFYHSNNHRNFHWTL